MRKRLGGAPAAYTTEEDQGTHVRPSPTTIERRCWPTGRAATSSKPSAHGMYGGDCAGAGLPLQEARHSAAGGSRRVERPRCTKLPPALAVVALSGSHRALGSGTGAAVLP